MAVFYGSSAVWSRRRLPKLQRSLLPPSTDLKSQILLLRFYLIRKYFNFTTADASSWNKLFISNNCLYLFPVWLSIVHAHAEIKRDVSQYYEQLRNDQVSILPEFLCYKILRSYSVHLFSLFQQKYWIPNVIILCAMNWKQADRTDALKSLCT